MKKYSVIFLRPEIFYDRYKDVPYGKDTYISEVEADDVQSAIAKGREELYQADISDYDTDEIKITRRGYKVVMVLEGHPKVALYGWQTNE